MTEWSQPVWSGSGLPWAKCVTMSPGRKAAATSRTVGGPQIRNRGTLGGNLGTASPAGDALPPADACDAAVVLGSERTAYDDAVPWLIVRGAKVDATNRMGETPLIVAVQQRLSRSDDAAEGVRSFVERRPARFTGR